MTQDIRIIPPYLTLGMNYFISLHALLQAKLLVLHHAKEVYELHVDLLNSYPGSL
jgi:hypothetical protein